MLIIGLNSKLAAKAFGRGITNDRLCSSAGNPHLKFLKGRVFEIPVTGAFFLTEEELDDYFSVGNELEIKYYLTNDKLRENFTCTF